jgi:biotin carboxylase
MNNRPVAVVLGGTVPHKALIGNLKRRGYFTVLIDYYENPPAKSIADKHIRESTLDQEKVLQIARKLNAKLVISTCIDQANLTACYVSEKLGLPAPYGYEIARHVTNKILMKQGMMHHGIPTARFVCVRDKKDCENHGLKFPVIVKPADSNSSKGVRRACHDAELRGFVDQALKISRCGEVIIEEYKGGAEVSVDCFVKNKKAAIITTKERRKIAQGGDLAEQIYGSIWPAEISQKNKKDFKEIAEQIAAVFHLDNTPLLIQAIVDGDRIDVIEFAPRIGGGENFRIIELSTGFDMMDAAINSFFGFQVRLGHALPQTYYADNYLYAKAGLFGGIAGHEELLKNKLVEYVDSYKTRGAEIGAELSSNNRVGVFTVKSDDRCELLGKINAAVKSIEVYDIRGKSIMRKDIYGDG